MWAWQPAVIPVLGRQRRRIPTASWLAKLVEMVSSRFKWEIWIQYYKLESNWGRWQPLISGFHIQVHTKRKKHTLFFCCFKETAFVNLIKTEWSCNLTSLPIPSLSFLSNRWNKGPVGAVHPPCGSSGHVAELNGGFGQLGVHRQTDICLEQLICHYHSRDEKA